MQQPDTPQLPIDAAYLQRAMELADAAAACGEVPIGAVLVSGELVIEAKNEKELAPMLRPMPRCF